MKKISSLLVSLAMAVGLLASGAALAAGSSYKMDTAPDRSKNLPALQNGAKLFVNYCLNCHSASAVRYNRLTELGLTEKQIKDNLLFTGEKVGDMMTVAARPKDQKEWFGAQPPDLSLITRAKSTPSYSGSDYLYTYMRTFYRDDTRDTGWNNMAYPNVGMPHVFFELQGHQRAVFVDKPDPHDKTKTVKSFERFEQVSPGSMNRQQYDEAVADLVGFLQWASEPVQTQRKQLGVLVLVFLTIMAGCAYWLNSTYWKDVH
jgi:ubiquinol-cytochrome c reductase cytochrome c1 subunit